MDSKWYLIRRTFSIWARHHAMRLSAGVAFYTMLAIAPLLVVALNVLSIIYGHRAAQKIGEQVNAFVGTESADTPDAAVHQILHVAAHSRHGLLAASIAFVIALVSGSSLFACLQDAINTMWDVKPHIGAARVAVRNRMIAGAMMLVAAALLMLSFVVSATMGMIVHHLAGGLARFSFVGDEILSLVVVGLLFAIVYRYLPAVKIGWRDVWLGASITAGLFLLGKLGLTGYFRAVAVQTPYGAAGSLAALLIWVYYSTTLIFIGVAFTRAHAEYRGKPIQPDQFAYHVPDPGTLQTYPPNLMVAPAPYVKAPPKTWSEKWLGLIGGATAGTVAAILFHSKSRVLRDRISEFELLDRLEKAEEDLRRAGKRKGTIQQMQIDARIDRVEARLKDLSRNSNSVHHGGTETRRER